MRSRLLLTTCLLGVCLTGVGVNAQQRRQGGQPGNPPSEQPARQEEGGGGGGGREVAGAAEEKISTTSHTITLDGKEVKYTATTGTLPIRLDDGKIAARMFFVAYTKDGEDIAKRPISFLYNGGPGAATVWLHMGSFGPRHVQMADDGFQPAPPYQLVDNDDSLLDTTDLDVEAAIAEAIRLVEGRVPA